jgi:uncharacterized membrane protein
MSSASADHPVFEALLTPHRSLSRGGAIMVTGAVLLGTTAFSLCFWLLGAWPIVLFSMIDVPLIMLLLALNFRRARASECVMLTQAVLTVIQTDPRGRRQQISVPTAWLRVSLQEEHGASHIVMLSRGRSYEVGAFLHDQDRLALYTALRDALYDVRNPRFDNPQLREP